MLNKLNMCDYGERFEKILGLWLELKSDKKFPIWKDFDVKNAAYGIGFLNAITVINEGEDFEYRVFGTNIVDAYSVELTRKRVSEVAPLERSQKSMNFYRSVVKTGEPQCVFQDVSDINALKPLFGEEERCWLRLVLPFSTDGETVDRLLGYGEPILLEQFGRSVQEKGVNLQGIYPVATDGK
ncbi:PAS domain-containing protein [Sneathiella aquimaris]|uniref:hypothetical protein n=1 Tax=Sneathiella aquimaris TaxID=2599305 RepID=UPI00146E7B3A|nr:hypothetical protein [Sneathiella aquimaris]